MESGRRERIEHPLLDELRGELHRLKAAPQPVSDGCHQLLALCESLEAVFRHGLKQPNSWFGLNRQDYWSWIERLQEYYFNEKMNPLLREVVTTVASSMKLRSLQGKGRCFLRIALCHKLVSVPIEHLVKNSRLTNYWYTSDSLISHPVLRKGLMEVLFELTEVDFKLTTGSSSFLDETWTIPIYVPLALPPIRTLDVSVLYIDGRALIARVEEDCLAQKGGVEVGDVLDELCGEVVRETSHGKLKNILVAKSKDSTDMVIVKTHLSDGYPFHPILQRWRMHADQSGQPVKELLKRKPSAVVRTLASCTQYTVVYLGKRSGTRQEPSEKVVDDIIFHVLKDRRETKETGMRVSSSEVVLVHGPREEVLAELPYSALCGCGRGSLHQSCLVLLALRPSEEGEEGRTCTGYVYETSSIEMASAVCSHIARGFNRSGRLKKAPTE